jgi:hypothetical protein
MAFQDWLTTDEISTIFDDELVAAGGHVTDRVDDGTRLFLRSTLPGEREVQAGDLVQGGVALRATEDEISVHPYVFRQVCRNGAIMAQATQTRRIERVDFSADLDYTLRETIQACCAPDAFRFSVDSMRSSLEAEVNIALMMMPMLARLPSHASTEILKRFARGFAEGRDRSRFGFMNAVTSTARDTRDPEVRWRLEEFGGMVASGIAPRNPRPASTSRRVAVSV